MDFIHRFSVKAEIAIRILVVLFMMFMLGTVLLDVLARNTPIRIRGLDELARYSLIWIIFLATAAGARYGDLIGMDALMKVFPQRLQVAFWLLRRVLVLAFLVAFGWYALGLVQLMIQTGRSSPNLHIPLWLVYAPLFLGTALMFLSLLTDALRRATNGTFLESPDPDEGSQLWN